MADLQSQLQPLLSGLFGVFQIAESGENQYVMKCIARLITFIGPQVLIVMSKSLTGSLCRAAWHLPCIRLNGGRSSGKVCCCPHHGACSDCGRL